MPASGISFGKLFIHDDSYGNSITDIYVGDAERAGRESQKLVVLIELPRERTDYRPTADAIVERAASAFHAATQLTPELILESVLESLNLALPELAPPRSPLFDQLNLLIALSDRGQIHFSHIGDIRALLVQEGKSSLLSEEGEAINPLKLFGHVTSGLLNPGDALLFTTPPLVDYVSEAKIAALIKQFPPELSVSKIERLLAGVPQSVTFAAVIIKFTTELDELAARRGLAPSASDAAETAVIRPAPPTAATARQRSYSRRPSAPMNRLWSALAFFFRNFLLYLKLLGRLLRIGTSALAATAASLLYPRMRHERESGLVHSTTTAFAHARATLSRRPRSTRYSLAALGALVFLLMNILLIRGQEQYRARSNNDFSDTLERANEKRRQAENATIYNNRAAAESLFIEIQLLLGSAQPRNQEQRDILAQYQEETKREISKIRRINYIASPLVFANLDDIDDKPINNLHFVGDDLYLTAGPVLYRFRDGKATLAANADERISLLLNNDENKTIFTLSASLTFSRLDGATLPPLSLNLPPNASIQGGALYGNNLYLLDAGNGTILKTPTTKTQAPSEWANNPALLTGAYDLTIDGAIYVIGRDGTIMRFLRGAQQNFSYQPLLPAPGAGSRIHTRVDSPFLYLMDPANRRVIILDKKGPIQDQYTSPAFAELTALTTNPAEDTLYVVSGGTVYVLAINKPR